MKYLEPNMTADTPYEFRYFGEPEVDGDDYSILRYCLEKDDDVYDGWMLKICYQDYYFQKGIHIFTIFVSICLLGSIMFIYAYFKELRDFHGKTIIAITGSQIFTYLTIPFIRYFTSYLYSVWKFVYTLYALFASSLVMILLWITVLIIHSYLTFKNFKNQTTIPYEFSTYAIFVFSFTIFSTFVFVQEILSYDGHMEYLFFIYFFIGFIDVVLLIITGVKIIYRSRHLEHSEQARFDTEKKWYYIIIKISLMMMVTLLFEISIWSRDFNLLIETTVDFVSLLTATSMFLMLVGREKVRILLFGKYREVNDI
ncbi:G-protein coupled receptor Mth2-like isoform X3 [Chironomus tepperi]